LTRAIRDDREGDADHCKEEQKNKCNHLNPFYLPASLRQPPSLRCRR
jgi:hypothetical protein